MALPTKEERIRRKKVMQAAGIKVPNTDESWGPWWEKQWQKAITHTKTNEYYGVPSFHNLYEEQLTKLLVILHTKQNLSLLEVPYKLLI